MDKAEPLTDAEAKAVLLALGPSLCWLKNPYFADEFRAGTFPVEYVVGRTKNLFEESGSSPTTNSLFYWCERIESLFLWQLPEVLRSLREDRQTWRMIYLRHYAFYSTIGQHECKFFKTADAAKLACECHHATGKWE